MSPGISRWCLHLTLVSIALYQVILWYDNHVFSDMGEESGKRTKKTLFFRNCCGLFQIKPLLSRPKKGKLKYQQADFQFNVYPKDDTHWLITLPTTDMCIAQLLTLSKIMASFQRRVSASVSDSVRLLHNSKTMKPRGLKLCVHTKGVLEWKLGVWVPLYTLFEDN